MDRADIKDITAHVEEAGGKVIFNMPGSDIPAQKVIPLMVPYLKRDKTMRP